VRMPVTGGGSGCSAGLQRNPTCIDKANSVTPQARLLAGLSSIDTWERVSTR
jgi:hypothetical protein